MKLTDLAIDASQTNDSLQLNRLHHGLNVICDAAGGQRDEIVRLIRYVLFGLSRDREVNGIRQNVTEPGHLDIARGAYRFRLTRSSAADHALQVQGLDNTSQIYSNDEMLGPTDPALFDALYDLNFEQVTAHLQSIPQTLVHRLGVPSSENRWASEDAYRLWRQEADLQKLRWRELSAEVQGLEQDRNRWNQELSRLLDLDAREQQQRERQLNEIDLAIARAQRPWLDSRRELDRLHHEIESLRNELERRASEIEYCPVDSALNALELLYGQYDLIAKQIADWEQARDLVQAQRVHWRREIEEWADLPLDAEPHPYCVAHRELQQLQDFLDRFDGDRTPKTLADSGEALSKSPRAIERVAASQVARANLESVRHELAAQYYQLRHKSAAAAMKGLREHFQTISANLAALKVQQERVADELRRVDPDGARAIELASPEFRQSAEAEGSYAARLRWAADPPCVSGDYRALLPDLDRERAQLGQLQLLAGELLERVAANEAQVQELQSRRAAQSALNDRQTQPALSQVRDRLQAIDSALASRNQELERLNRIVSENDAAPPFTASPVLTQASQFLSRLSGGRWTGISIAAVSPEILVSDASGFRQAALALPADSQHEVLLALGLAANAWLNQLGSAWPMILREVFPSNQPDKARQIASLLREFGLAGHQLLAFTRDSQIADLISQQLVSGTFSLFRTPRGITQVGTLPPLTRDIVNHFAASAVPLAAAGPSSHPPVSIPATMALASNPATDRNAESSWYRQDSTPVSPRSNRPVVYTDRSDFRTFPIYRPPASIPQNAAVPESSIAGTIRPATSRSLNSITEHTLLRQVDLADTIHLANLMKAGLQTIGDLLSLDPANLRPELSEIGCTAEQLDRWQAQAWLLLCVPSLTPSDARVLVACGIVEPEQLDTTSAEQLSTRIQRYLTSPDGRRFAPTVNRYQLSRIQAWHRDLQETRSRWRKGPGYSRRMRRNPLDRDPAATRESETRFPPVGGNYFAATRPRDYQPGNGYFARGSQVDSDIENEEFHGLNPVTVGTTPDLPAAPTGSKEAQPEIGQRFFLNLSDSVASAPSIGPRTAQRFTGVGVQTIADFLRMTAESMAEKINYKRLTANVIRQWQQQARLVCQVPNLRGHDAQLLVGVGIVDAEQLAAIQPRRLFEKIRPFAESKEGLKIIRAGQKPDLQEVSDWVSWAQHTRTLQAA